MDKVIVVIGAGSIGQAIARRVSAGKHVLLADLRQQSADAAAKVLGDAGFEVSTATVDVSSRESVHALVERAAGIGDITGIIHAAGVSPSQAPPATILKVDLYGTAVVLEEFGSVIARGGAGVVIASQSGHRLPALTLEQNTALATTPADELLALPMLQPDQVADPLRAYQLSKRGNSLRVMAEAVRWGKRGARVNTISPGIIITPLARDELSGPRGEGYRRMIELCPVGRAGTPDEVGTVGALLMLERVMNFRLEKELYIVITRTHHAWDAKETSQDPRHQYPLSERCDRRGMGVLRPLFDADERGGSPA